MKIHRVKVTEQLLTEREHTEDYYKDQLGHKRYIAYHRDHVVVETESNIVILKAGDYITVLC